MVRANSFSRGSLPWASASWASSISKRLAMAARRTNSASPSDVRCILHDRALIDRPWAEAPLTASQAPSARSNTRLAPSLLSFFPPHFSAVATGWRHGKLHAQQSTARAKRIRLA